MNKISHELAPLSRFHKKLIAAGIAGQVSNGYVLGAITIPLSMAIPALELSAAVTGLIGSASLLGLTVGSFTFGKIADMWGRRWLFIHIMLLSLIFSVCQYFIASPEQFWFIRFSLGLFVGADYAAAIPLLNEWLPKKSKVLTMSSLMVAWTFGYVLAYAVGCMLVDFLSWKIILCTSAVPAAIALYLRNGLPESPKWIASKKSLDLANKIIIIFLGKDYCLVPESAEQKIFNKGIFARGNLKNTMVGGIFYACQCFPYYSLTIFLPMILHQFNMQSPYASGIIFNIFLLLGAPVGCWLAFRLSRRSFLMCSFYLCATFFLVLIIFPNISPMFVLACISLFAFCLSSAVVLETLYPAELFPSVLRASGVGFCVGCGGLGSISGTFLLPIMLEKFGSNAVSLSCFAVLLGGGIVCQLFAPETSSRFHRG